MEVNCKGTSARINKDKIEVEVCIATRFRQQVEKYPYHIAIQTEHTSLTYHQLDQEINWIAFAIQNLISNSDGQIVLLVEQNEVMIASLFAVLATNNAYVSLDSSYPEERLNFIVQDCAASLILTDQNNYALAARLAGEKNIPIILVNNIQRNIKHSFIIQSKPDSHAYILYTSGTKGKPKGVLQNHRNVLYFNQVYTHALKIQANDKLTLLASFCFDAAVMDIFAALLNGATLYPYSIKTNTAADCLAWIESNKLSIYHSTPTVFRYLFQSNLCPDKLTSLRLVVLGGEVALKKDWQLYYEHCPKDCLLVNGYGPTESSVTTQYVMDKNTQITTATLPIGYAVIGTNVFLKINNEINDDVYDEIIINSPYVALRYWGMPALTKKVFTGRYPDRQYYTGDLGRLLPNGAIEYYGRLDDQVKISGYRIELNEITHYLLEYPAIKQVVCLARPHPSDRFQLAVYFIADKKLHKNELSSYLKRYLPEYMVPTIFIQVTDIPKTPNGKVDREALITHEQMREITGLATSTPNLIEKQLIDICETLLQVKSMQSLDNIFELGCNSLLAMQLTNRISQSFNIKFSIKCLFSSPTIAGLSHEITTLQSQNTFSVLASIASHPRENSPLASYAQQQFLFLSSLDSACDFSLAISVKMLGIVQAPLLQKAFLNLINRHEILRTILNYQNNQLVQIIHAEPLCHLEVNNLFHIEDGLRVSSIEEMGRIAAKIPFDPLKGPLIRATLLQYDPRFQVLLISCSHSVMDGWALNIFSHELSIIYNLLLDDKSESLPDIKFQYADYSSWQNNLLLNNAFDHQRCYWLKQLANLPPPIQFEKKSSLISGSSHKSLDISFVLSEDTLTQLQQFCDKHQATLFMAILSIFQILLFRYSGQEDIIVGTPTANRHLAESAQIIGCFVNTIALRGRPNEKLSFLDFLQKIKEVTLDAYDNQDLPFSKVVESLKLTRDRDISPVFQVLLTVDNIHKYDFSFKDVISEVIEISQNQSYFDLDLSFEMINKTLSGKLKYRSNFMSSEVARHFVNSFEILLIACITKPQESLDYLIESIGVTKNPYTQQQIIDWNRTECDYPLERTIAELFAEQVEKNPDKTAVTFVNEHLSYRELNEKSNQLAHYLIAQGVTQNTIVAICLERSMDLVISLLAILKANAAYLPLDTEFPFSRIKTILEDAKPVFIITHSMFNKRLSSQRYISRLLIDEENLALTNFSKNNPPITILSTDLFYVMYTSGSTGQPKGVMVSQLGILNRLWWMQNTLKLTEADVVLQKSPYTADTSVWEFFWPLLFGARLVVAIPHGHRDAAYLCKTIIENNITVVDFVPSLLRLFLEEKNVEACGKSLRFVILGGEEFLLDDQARFLNIFKSSPVELYNLYGPTEASIGICYWRCVYDNALNFVPIGRPIANTQLYILDELLQPLPIGVAGTLYIGGVSLAKGYLNRPALTKERFIENPFSSLANKKLYNTGDLCRWTQKGFIQFLGRCDSQIKIRGHRIELGEIENKFKQHPGVKNCVLTVHEDDLQQKKLVAYFIPNLGFVLTHQELQQFLALHLPYYMIPTIIISVADFPLNSNGKLDRKALPFPDVYQSNVNAHYSAPRNHIENRLSHIWSQLLNISPVGVHDNFFYIGGHSLLAVQMNARIYHEFKVEIPLRKIFLEPTISAIADAIAKQKQHIELQALIPVSRDQLLPLSHTQQRLWFFDQFEHNNLYNISKAWQLTGTLDYLALKTSFQYLIERHESLRTIFVIHNNQPYQHIAPLSEMELPFSDLSFLTKEAQKNKLASYYQEEASHLFDMTIGPLFRIKLIKLERDIHIFSLTIHHIIADGWSIHILLRDLSSYCESLRSKMPVSLPKLSIQYADYAYWQEKIITGERFNQQLVFWKNHLKNAPPLLKFPTDKLRPMTPNYEGGNYSFTLTKELQQQLHHFSQQQQVTLFITLLTAFYSLLYRYTGVEDIVIGTAIANRNHLETEELIGYFANTLALRSKVTSQITFLMLLDQIRDTVFLAQENQDLAFEKLFNHLKIERNLSYHPLFQVMFILQNTPACDYSFGEASLSKIDLSKHNCLSKFDMTWNAHEIKEGIEITIEYSKALFQEETISSLSKHWEVLLQAIIAMPQETIAKIPLLSAHEKQMLMEWNKTEADYPHEDTVHHQFEKRVVLCPDNIAIQFQEAFLTYRELNEKANQLAHYLLMKGIAPGSLVAICLERSIDLVICIFGIIKAGSAYLPLDTTAPKNRLAFILEDSKSVLLITKTEFSQDIIPELILDKGRVGLEDQPRHNPTLASSSSQLIYVIYTSGSTGQPKGVLIEHRSVMNILTALQKKYPVQEKDAYLLKTPPHFDASVTELLGWFWQGGRAVILEQGQEKDALNLFALIHKNRITHAGFVPTLLHMWTKLNPDPDKLSSLKYVFIVGELITKTIAQQILKLLPSTTQFINIYGPTEATVYATDFKLSLEDTYATIPIGKPLSNIKTYILDDYLNPVPRGVCGDIFIGGVGVGRHYINRPELSAEKFIADPFSQPYHGRLYKTGDLGRFLADGNIEFLGRADYQIKIRGFRVELGEIENYLSSHPDIQQAIVIVQNDTAEEKQLVAYFIASKNTTPASSVLRSFLRSYFPDYMVPIAYVALSAFPINANGKLDRLAFPESDIDRSALEQNYVAPGNDMELSLANLWSEILNISQIGIHDNFFHLGGHSLLVVQLVAKIRSVLNIELALCVFFQNPTIKELAAHINREKEKAPLASQEFLTISCG